MKQYEVEKAYRGFRIKETDGNKVGYLYKTTRTGWVFTLDYAHAKYYKREETAIHHADRLQAFANCVERWKAQNDEGRKTDDC